ncbi:MAG: thiamine phosphate synthase [Bryobacteraceae bacterium]
MTHSALRIPRFYPILDVEITRRRGFEPGRAAREILDGGARILQFRWKGFFSRREFSELESIREQCQKAGALLVVNDRADIARLAGAALHLGQDDLTPSTARQIAGPDAVIGYSTHNEAQLRAAASELADYLAIGPIFATSSKMNPDPVLGLAELRRLRPLTSRPLVAIGGISRSNALSVLETGADSVAVIGDLFPENGNLRTRAAEWISLLGS